MIQKINYADKQTGGKFSASDANEIKSTINSNADVLSENSQSILSLQGGPLGSIKPTDAAPTPARNGNYTFSIGGNKPAWLTAEAGVTEVKAGDGVAVVYAAPSSYTYTHVDVSSDFVLKDELVQVRSDLSEIEINKLDKSSLSSLLYLDSENNAATSRAVKLINDKVEQVKDGGLEDGSIEFPKLSPTLAAYIGSGGSVTNQADDEDLEVVSQKLKLKDNTYSLVAFSGLGYKRLRKNIIGNVNVLLSSAINLQNTIYEIKYDFNLNGQTITLPSNIILKFIGGSITNGAIIGNNTIIDCPTDYTCMSAITFSGTFLSSSNIYVYSTVQVAKTKYNYPGKIIKVNGFYYENDGGDAEYRCDIQSVFVAENPYFQSYWEDTSTAGGAGLYVKMNNLWAKYISKKTSINLSSFGIKYDALYLNNTDKKYYSDASYTTLATDNYNCTKGAIGQLMWWGKSLLPNELILSGVLIINTKLQLTHGAYNFILRGSNYSDSGISEKVCISSNSNLDCLIENIYSTDSLTGLTGFTARIYGIKFNGQNRIANGMIWKNGYETDDIQNCRFDNFTNAGLVLFGISSTYKLHNISCFHNKYGILITSYHPFYIDGSSNPITNNSEGIYTLKEIQGDWNTDSLIAFNCLSDGASFNIQSIKSENQNASTIHILKSSQQQYISIQNAFINGTGDFIKIDNYGGLLPVIKMSGVYQNDSTLTHYDINDLINTKQIRFPKNPTGSFPDVIYTNADYTQWNGFIVFRNGVKTGNTVFRDSGITANRPNNSTLPVGFMYFDNTLNKPIYNNGSNWVDANGTTV